MSETEPLRPRQVTFAAWMIMAGSVLVLVSVFEHVAGLQSLETRERIETFLSEPPGDGLGIGANAVTDLLRTLALVTGGCAAAAAILGYQVLQRSRSARLVLSVLAVPLFLAGMTSGGFMSALVAAASVMLWFQPARDWFDGKAPRPAPEPPPRPVPAPVADPPQSGPPLSGPPAPVPPTYPAPQQGAAPGAPPPYVGFGEAPSWPAAPGMPAYAPARTAGAPRPQALIWACALTWTICALVTVGMLLTSAVLAASPDAVFDELYQQNPDLADAGLSRTTLTTAVFVLTGIFGLWCVAASVFAALAFRGTAWARTALLVSAAVATVLLVLTVIGNIAMVIPLAACLGAIMLLLRPEVRAWRPRG
ncbi:MAG: hypothetical protein F2667_08120 [Actinobacteria bacterium]|uniref:Unannotated protein n=1 Tax=freshwater metagenome TaxID=449393 RepID=A0A6J6QPH9_9ZZZZ|nr:hypothetical protein [Actinomycetota bacterium]